MAAIGMAVVNLALGGAFSFVLIQEKLAPLLSDTFFVPGYFHFLTVGTVTLTFLGALCYVIPGLTGRPLWNPRLLVALPYVVTVGLVAFGAAGIAALIRRAPGGTWLHWLLYDLPSGTRGLPEGIAKDRRLPDGSHQGRNDFGKIGYNGPCPPPGAVHRYYFRLYALNRRTDLGPGASRSELERAMKDHILAQTELVGRFQH